MKFFVFILLLLSITKSYSQEEILAIPLKHSSYLKNLVFTSDRRYVYTVSDDKTIKLWYFSGALYIKTFHGHQDEITNLVVNASNTHFFSTDKSKTIIHWDTYNGKILNQIKTDGVVRALYLNEKENILITGEDNGQLNFYQLPEMKKIKSISTAPLYVFKILQSKEPNQYFLGMRRLPNLSINENIEKGNILIYNAKHDKLLPLSTYTDDLACMSFVPDSSKILTASAENNMVRIWDASRLFEESNFKTNILPATIFAARNNKMIGIGAADNSEVKVYRNTGSEIFTIDLDTGTVVYGEFNKDITRIHILNSYGQFKVFDFQANLRHIYGYYASVNNKITATAYNSKNKFLAAGYDNGKTLIFNLKTNEMIFVPDSGSAKIELLCFDTTSNYLAIAYQTKFFSDSEFSEQANIQSKIAVYNIENNQIVKRFIYQDKYITSIHANSSLLFIGFNNGEVEIYDLRKNNKLNTLHVAPFDIIKLFYINKHLIAQSFDNKISIFNLTENYTLKLTKTINTKSNEIMLDANADFILTNNQKISLTSNQSIPISAISAKLLPKTNTIHLNETSIQLLNNTEQIWTTNINFENSKSIMLDNYSQFCIITNPFSMFSFYNSITGQHIGDLYFSGFNSWIFTTKLNYDASESIIPKIKVVKGIVYSQKAQNDQLRIPKLISTALKLNIP